MANIRTRQYIGILAAVLSYYLLHEGAHLITALCMGVFKEVKFLGVGMQVDVAAAQIITMPAKRQRKRNAKRRSSTSSILKTVLLRNA